MTTALTLHTAPSTPVAVVQGAITSPFVRADAAPEQWLTLALTDQCSIHLRIPNADATVFSTAAALCLMRFPGIRKGDVPAAFMLLSAGLLGARPETYHGQVTPAQIVDIMADYYTSETNKAARESLPDPRMKQLDAASTQARLEAEYRVQLAQWQAHPEVERQIAAHNAEVEDLAAKGIISPLKAAELRREYEADLAAYRIRHKWPATWGQLGAVECSYMIRTYPNLFDWQAAVEQAAKVTEAEVQAAHEGAFTLFMWESEKSVAKEKGKSITSLVAAKLAVWNYLQSL